MGVFSLVHKETHLIITHTNNKFKYLLIDAMAVKTYHRFM